ncbi:MAG: LruC domain-containing protein, partial [Spirochaetia bacterium]|nr:LruC domain-containing protein [Spirochaetia bacterium]
MNTQRKRITLLLLAGMLGFSASCNTASDPNYAWLTGIANGTVTSTSSDPVPFSINVSDVTGDPAFMFDTTRTIPVFISVRDPISPLAGSLVQVLDMTNGATGAVIFQAVTNPDGTISGQFTINQTQQQVVILVTVNGQLLRIVVDISNVAEIRRFIFIEATVTPSIPIADRDGDGVADSQDAYPDDATRSSMVRIPGDSNYSIAYEDLYPVQGDADFNDYVVRVYNEEDLNAAGLVTRVRGSYTHIACGAGYKHRLMLQLPAGTGTYTLSV